MTFISFRYSASMETDLSKTTETVSSVELIAKKNYKGVNKLIKLGQAAVVLKKNACRCTQKKVFEPSPFKHTHDQK